jgi:peptidoglycan/LPS O-acetylase OafA/YrhL
MMVCLFHFSSSSNYLPDGNVLKVVGSYGAYGVQMFFVISGFVLPYSLSKSGYTLGNFGNFVLRRIVRLDPPYILSIVIVVILAYVSTLSPLYRGKPFQFNWGDALFHLGYLNSFVGRPWLSPVYWTLAIEFQFYLLLGLLYPVFSNSNNFTRGIIIVVFLSLALWLRDLGLIFCHGPLFLMGIFSFLCYQRKLKAVPFFLLLAVCYAIGWSSFSPKAITFGLCTVPAIFLLNVSNRFLLFLGQISYSLYLLHVPIGSRVTNLTEALTTDVTLRLMGIALAFGASIVASALFYRFVEEPAIRWSRDFVTNGKWRTLLSLSRVK